MENIRNTKFYVIFWLITAFMNYGAFCYDLEKDKDWMTYGWLLYSIVSFCMFIIYGIKLEILRNQKEK